MNLFSGKKSKQADRDLVTILPNAENTIALAFGIKWLPIMVTGGLSDAVTTIRKQGATHYNPRPQQVGSGYVDVKANPIPDSCRVFAAAQVLARLHGGDLIAAVHIVDGEYWLCKIQGGRPSSIDRYWAPDKEIDFVDEVHRLVDIGQQEGVNYRVYTNLDPQEFKNGVRLDVDDLVKAAANREDEFIRIPADSRFTVPRPVLYGLGVVCLILIGNEAWKYKIAQDRKRAAQLKLAEANEPPEVVWSRALKEWEQSTTKPSSAGLAAVRKSLDQVPVLWSGWMMQDITCNAGALVGTAVPKADGSTSYQESWSCVAKYLRSVVGITSAEMSVKIPEQWKANFTGVDAMTISWAVAVDASPISVAGMPDFSSYRLQAFSTVQQQSPSFEQLPALPFAPVTIPAPKKSDGSVYPPNPVVPDMKTAKLVIKSPLRSLDAFLEKGLDVAWTSLVVTPVSLSQYKSVQTGVKASPLTAQATGVIYAKGN